jgi:hypothetical protein
MDPMVSVDSSMLQALFSGSKLLLVSTVLCPWNKDIAMFMRPQTSHFHSSDGSSIAMYSESLIERHVWWNHTSHPSHCGPPFFQVTALAQRPQGNFGVLGPGFKCMSPARIIIRCKVIEHTLLLGWIAFGRVREWFRVSEYITWFEMVITCLLWMLDLLEQFPRSLGEMDVQAYSPAALQWFSVDS